MIPALNYLDIRYLFVQLVISYQRYLYEYQRRRRVTLKADGLCIICADPRRLSKCYCDRCLVNRRKNKFDCRIKPTPPPVYGCGGPVQSAPPSEFPDGTPGIILPQATTT